ncbi:MAG: hypothetical protein ACFCBW_01835, partial [Candidatus Competibacterales bacterium]
TTMAGNWRRWINAPSAGGMGPRPRAWPGAVWAFMPLAPPCQSGPPGGILIAVLALRALIRRPRREGA